MSRLAHAILAGATAASLSMMTIPAGAHGHAHASGKTKAAAHTTTHASHTMTHAAPHVTVRHYEATHRGQSARYVPEKLHPQHAGVAHATLSRIEDESSRRFHEIGRTASPVSHVTLQRSALHAVTEHHLALTSARFVTGTVVSRQSNAVILRTQTGNTVTVYTQSVPLVSSAIVPGASVVLPAQYLNGQIVLVPSFAPGDQTLLANEPMLAPCAINDRDADDAGDSGYYAPANACLNNDGDADDAGNFTLQALPSSFGSVPQVFTSSYAPAVAAGFMVAQVGQNVVLMTPDFKPLVINASAALSSGATNGSLTPGRYVVAYGFDVNNTFVATSLM